MRNETLEKTLSDAVQYGNTSKLIAFSQAPCLSVPFRDSGYDIIKHLLCASDEEGTSYDDASVTAALNLIRFYEKSGSVKSRDYLWWARWAFYNGPNGLGVLARLAELHPEVLSTSQNCRDWSSPFHDRHLEDMNFPQIIMLHMLAYSRSEYPLIGSEKENFVYRSRAEDFARIVRANPEAIMARGRNCIGGLIKGDKRLQDFAEALIRAYPQAISGNGAKNEVYRKLVVENFGVTRLARLLKAAPELYLEEDIRAAWERRTLFVGRFFVQADIRRKALAGKSDHMLQIQETAERPLLAEQALPSVWLNRKAEEFNQPAAALAQKLVEKLSVLEDMAAANPSWDLRDDASALAEDHLPGLVNSYCNVPSTLRDKAHLGQTPDETLVSGLEKILNHAEHLIECFDQDSLDGLAIQGRALTYRYGSKASAQLT